MSSLLKDKFARLAALQPASRSEPLASSRDAGPAARSAVAAESGSLAQLLGAAVARNRYGEHLVVSRWFSSPEPCEPTAHALRLLAPLPRSPQMPLKPRRNLSGPATSQARADLGLLSDPAQWLFLDTETTGLAGGTGTYAFLIGLAWWESGGLRVDQLFMRDYDEEHSLLLELSHRMAERPVLITFNGKCFDWPLLETRYRMTRAIRPQAPAAHLDLLHPARQLWRPRLGSVRLAELERHVLDAQRLGWHRRDDIDAALIPQIYFDYLHRGLAEPLTDVFLHNQMDLRGLAALAGKILSLLSRSEAAYEQAEDALDLFGLSRLLRRHREDSLARAVCERALIMGLSGAPSRAARHELALLAKRQRDYARATSLWEDLIAEPEAGVAAYEQLAMYYEHHARDLRRAAELTRKAVAELRNAARLGLLDPTRRQRLQARLAHRLARLERKARRLQPRPFFAEADDPAGESNPP